MNEPLSTPAGQLHQKQSSQSTALPLVAPLLDGARLPSAQFVTDVVRPDAEVCVGQSSTEVRSVMNRLSVLSVQRKCGEIVLPPGVNHESIERLILEWRNTGNVEVGQSRSGEIVVRMGASHGGYGTGNHCAGEGSSDFALLTHSKLPLIAGGLIERSLSESWPSEWKNYDDCKGKRFLEHCCGGGNRVEFLRQQGVDAYGVDLCIFENEQSPFLHYGRPERLPFVDGAFDRVESRMGVLIWAQDSKDMCRESLAEMVRVTSDGGTIRILSMKEANIRDLIAERNDVMLVEQEHGGQGAFELRVRRPHT